jgi:NodT family efflux transporter outer membrane factor (OMF) lipoprotein
VRPKVLTRLLSTVLPKPLRGWPIRAPVLLLTCLLTGCLSAPEIQLDPPVPAQWTNLPAVNSSAAPATGSWWQAFDDKRLDALVDEAQKQNLGLAEAIERLRAARQLDRHARDPFLPNLSARTDDAIDPDASASFFVAGFDSIWEFGFFGQRASAERVGQAGLDAAVAGVRGARVSLTAEVVRRWIELRAARQQESVLLRLCEASADRVARLRVRAGLALASQAELANADAELAMAQAELAGPRRLINASMMQLAVLVGRNRPEPAWRDPGTEPVLRLTPLRSVPADMLRTRPEIASAEAAVLRAAGELGLSRAEMYPHIGLRTAVQWSTKITSDRPSPSRAIFALGPAIDIPLFDWGTRKANANAKGHELKAALLAYRQAVLAGVAEVEIALGDLEQLGQRQRALERAVGAATKALAAVSVRVELGLDSPMDRIVEQVAKQRRQLALIDARTEHDLSYIALHKALGGADTTAISPDDAVNR